MRIYAGYILVLCLAFSPPALAQKVTNLFSNSIWESYSFVKNKKKICYTAARANNAKKGKKDHPNTTVAVTHHGKTPAEVSLIGIYGFKNDSTVKLKIGTMTEILATKDKSAWAKDARADKKIIAAMIQGRDMVLTITTAKGEKITDTISLTGFSEGFDAINRACKVKK